jgi:hypothetical protein
MERVRYWPRGCRDCSQASVTGGSMDPLKQNPSPKLWRGLIRWKRYLYLDSKSRKMGPAWLYSNDIGVHKAHLRAASQMEQIVFEMKNNFRTALEMITIDEGKKPCQPFLSRAATWKLDTCETGDSQGTGISSYLP